MTANDFVGTPVPACQLTNGAGLVWWMGLRPGHYTVMENVPVGFFPTTPESVTVWLDSGESTDPPLEFGNGGPCDGLTPGYWKNWRNHYSEAEILVLLAGTIAPTIAEADAIFAHWDASPENELTILRAFLLANQLTLNLTQLPNLPNPSDGRLFGLCTVPGVPDDLAATLALALAIHNADGVGFTREQILAVAMTLDAFANLMP